MDYWTLARAEQERAPEDDLVRKHLRLAHYLAHKVRPPGLDFDERLGVANLALVEAARDWPRSKARQDGRAFSWFASYQINQAIRAAGENARGMRVPVQMRRQVREAVRAAGRLAERLDRSVTDQEVADELGWPVERVRELRALASTRDVLSLDKVVPGGDKGETTYVDLLEDPNADVEGEVLDRLQREEEFPKLREAVNALPPLMRATISLRVGIPVPAAQSLTVDEVLRVAAGLPSNTKRAVQKLREEAAGEIRSGGSMVPSDRERALDLGRAPSAPDTEARIHQAEDVWSGLARSGELPPKVAALAQ